MGMVWYLVFIFHIVEELFVEHIMGIINTWLINPPVGVEHVCPKLVKDEQRPTSLKSTDFHEVQWDHNMYLSFIMKDVMTSRQGNPLHFVPSMRHQVSLHSLQLSVGEGHLTYSGGLWHNRDFDWTIVQCVLGRNLVSRTEHIWEKMECTQTLIFPQQNNQQKSNILETTFRKERVEDITTHNNLSCSQIL